MECIQFEYEEKYVKEFINLPRMLYSKRELMEDRKDIYDILMDKHILSKYVDKLHKFLIYDGGKVVARFAITTYADDKEVAYLGFFECINDEKVAEYTFKMADEYVKSLGYTCIQGPVDIGMWYKYRLKINRFDMPPYTGEPYNKDYYYDMFKNNGYIVKDNYYSNAYNRLEKDFSVARFEKRYQDFIKKGYIIKSPTIDEWDRTISDVYELIMKMYRGFNTFREISKEDFIQIFSGYKKILNFDLVKIAYFEGKAVGFFIGIPNYSNRVYNVNLFSLIPILKIRKRADEYLMTYMAVDDSHRGLARALTQVIFEELKKKDAKSIGALIKNGTVTNNFVPELLNFNYEYVLMEKNVI